ncbi:predicted protein [Sclerotinia sclerotiorum 1980 UF-70]|uniref:Uncharacterized protein n=1 Tax=Sclerotinia sclerotiorum (strain ATCC 18683 / 1980 / Ss-1) TaxID=665079 RepID=A7EXX1_SCLS1|nr:predicted protein [Sclerotinia sclerotiorum 1980 UF-70]EDN94313.1 predicted protein [Sclerotinia sclerotiorum 1980 UF-70]
MPQTPQSIYNEVVLPNQNKIQQQEQQPKEIKILFLKKKHLSSSSSSSSSIEIRKSKRTYPGTPWYITK